MENGQFQVGSYLRNVARERWLSAEEVFIILCGYPNIDFTVTQFRQALPFDGELTLFGEGDRVKADGIVYSRKGGNSKDRERETFQDVKVNGAVLIKGRYSRTDPHVLDGEAPNPRPVAKCLKRRIYKLADTTHPSSCIVLVHYRECPEKEQVEKHSLHPSVFEQFNQFYARYLRFQTDSAELRIRNQEAPQSVILYEQIKPEMVEDNSAGSCSSFQMTDSVQQRQMHDYNSTIGGEFYRMDESPHQGEHNPVGSSSNNQQSVGGGGLALSAYLTSSSTVSAPHPSMPTTAPSQLHPQPGQQQSDDMDFLDDDTMDELLSFASDENHHHNHQSAPPPVHYQHHQHGFSYGTQGDRRGMMVATAAEAEAGTDAAKFANGDERQHQHPPPPPYPYAYPYSGQLPGLMTTSLACRSYDSYSSPQQRDSPGMFRDLAHSFSSTTQVASPRSTKAMSGTLNSGDKRSGVLAPEFKFRVVISDFSPTQDHQQGGGTKVLICLDNEIPVGLQKGNINVCFGDYRARYFVSARAEILGSTALRCKTPANAQSGSCQLWIEDEQQLLTSEPAAQSFEFIAPVSIQTVGASRLGKRPAFRGSIPADCEDNTNSITATTTAAAAAQQSFRLPPRFTRSSQRRASPLRSSGDMGGDFDKEHKIRIVEKLGTMKYALAHDEALCNGVTHGDTTGHGLYASTGSGGVSGGGSSNNLLFASNPRSSPRQQGSSSHNSFSFGDSSTGGEAPVEWLDDQELSQLSPEELEVLMDRYIMVVVKQLVQLAALDDDLKAEIDSLDSSGFSLLHYCCLYNLNSLIPVLLARGADVNRRTSTGSTALHLAAGAGHFAVTMALVDSGAQVDSLDANNVLPSDAAYEAGFIDIYNELLMRENRMVHTSSSTSAAAEVTSEMQDANTALIASNRALYGNNMSSSVHNTPLSHAAYSPVATAKSALDSTPPLMYDSPPPAFPSELYAYDISSSGGGGVGVGIGSTNEGGSSALSNKLLHEAFASLSLTDKCALSLSMSQSQQQGGGASPTPGSSKGGSKANTPRTSKVNLSNISLGALEGSMGLGMGLGIGISGGGLSGGGSLNTSSASVCGNVDEMSEIQSVLSETDKESLDVAMSMMGHFELRQVEDEVRTIQNNVRGWILRKNYTNLREAARVLQVAWREKRRVSVPHGMFNPATGQHQQQQRIGSPASQSEDKSPTSNLRDSMDSTGGPAYVQSGGSNNSNSGGGGASGAMDVVAANGPGITLSAEPNPTQQMAAATLQAATRAMLSRRRSFSSVRKQTMASLVIQKSLVKWWEHSKVGAQESAAVGAARISAHSTG